MVLKEKYKANKSVEKFKAKLVAKDFSHRKGIDYEKTYSLVIKFISTRIILSIAIFYDRHMVNRCENYIFK